MADHCFAEIRQGYVRLTKNALPAVPDNTEVEEFNIPDGTYGAVYTGVNIDPPFFYFPESNFNNFVLIS